MPTQLLPPPHPPSPFHHALSPHTLSTHFPYTHSRVLFLHTQLLLQPLPQDKRCRSVLLQARRHELRCQQRLLLQFVCCRQVRCIRRWQPAAVTTTTTTSTTDDSCALFTATVATADDACSWTVQQHLQRSSWWPVRRVGLAGAVHNWKFCTGSPALHCKTARWSSCTP
jgi:hypothetical protein